MIELNQLPDGYLEKNSQILEVCFLSQSALEGILKRITGIDYNIAYSAEILSDSALLTLPPNEQQIDELVIRIEQELDRRYEYIDVEGLVQYLMWRGFLPTQNYLIMFDY